MSKKTKDLEKIFDQDLILKQTSIIDDLTKRNHELEEELKHLKELFMRNAATSGVDVSNVDPEVIISETQLNMLKESSFNRQLTLEETKRVEIYHKILNVKRLSPQVSREKQIAEAEDADLIKLVEETVKS